MCHVTAKATDVRLNFRHVWPYSLGIKLINERQYVSSIESVILMKNSKRGQRMLKKLQRGYWCSVLSGILAPIRSSNWYFGSNQKTLKQQRL